MTEEKRQIKYIVNGARWFDKVNGNTYHSVRVTRCEDNATIADMMQYGYDDAYRQTALKLMLKNGWISGHTEQNVYMFERDNNYPIFWNVVDGTKKECKLNGVL